MQINWDLLMLGLGALFIYGLFFWWSQIKGATSTLRFSSTKAVIQQSSGLKPKLAKLSPWLRLLALLCILIALAQPRKGEEAVQVYKKGIAIQMLLDRSSSMNSEMDYQGTAISRFQVVKRVFKDFLLGNSSSLAGRPSDRIGLTTFARFVEEEAPLTLDHETLNHIVQSLHTTNNPLEDGTMIGDGLYYAALRMIAVEELFSNDTKKVRLESKIIILLTDGQQTQGGFDPLQAAQFAAENGIKVYTIAIVSKPNNSIFSIFNQPLNTDTVQEISKITGGNFYKAESGAHLLKIYEQINQLEKTDFEEHFTSYEEYYLYFVAFGIFFLLLEFLLSRILLARFAS